MCSIARAGEGFKEQLRGPELLVLQHHQKIHTNVTSEVLRCTFPFLQLWFGISHSFVPLLATKKKEKKKKPSSLSDHVTCFSCDQYLIILILLAA